MLSWSCSCPRGFHPEVSNPSLCIAYTDHISHTSAYPISGGVTRTEMFPSLSEEDTDTTSTGSVCREVNRPMPSLPSACIAPMILSPTFLTLLPKVRVEV
jgi:hypothetical protein